MSPVDADVIFLAEYWNGEVDRLERCGINVILHLGPAVLDLPARIAVRLPDLGWLVLTALVDLPFLYRCLLILGVALFRRRHHNGVDDLTAHHKMAAIGQRRIEASEEPVDRLCLHQALAEQPQSRRVRHRAVQTKA